MNDIFSHIERSCKSTTDYSSHIQKRDERLQLLQVSEAAKIVEIVIEDGIWEWCHCGLGVKKL